MPVAISQVQATIAIRAATSEATIAAPVAETVGLLWPAAIAAVEAFAPDAPDSVLNVAAVRLLGWLYDSDPAESAQGRALQASGAAPLLAQWRIHRAGAIGAAAAASPTPTPTPTPTPSGGELPPRPTGAGRFILVFDNGVLTWAAFPSP